MVNPLPMPMEQMLTMNNKYKVQSMIRIMQQQDEQVQQIVVPVFYVVYLYSTGTAYVTNTDLSLYYEGGINIQTLTAFLANTAVTVATSEISSAVGDLVNKKIYVQVDTADPTGGVAGQYVRIKGYYKVISVL